MGINLLPIVHTYDMNKILKFMDVPIISSNISDFLERFTKFDSYFLQRD